MFLVIDVVLLPLGCGEPGSPAYAPLEIATTSLPTAAPTVAYSATLAATGGDSSYTWTVVSGSLPMGLGLTASTGVISGTPIGSGSTFTVQVVSGDGQAASQRLTIDAYAILSVSTTSLPMGFVGHAYSEALAAAGGNGSYTWSITAGSLPAGLHLNDSTGVISGTPVDSGSTFTVQVASGDGQTALRQLAIPAAPLLQPSERCSDYSVYAIATFEDSRLSRAVRTALSVSAPQDLACGLVSGLTGLSANDEGIGSLVGIQNLTSLEVLHLGGNSIVDIDPLRGLGHLRDLVLEDNSIGDVDALGNLTGLTRLSLGNNAIGDLGALSGLTSLASLNLWGNSISDVSALQGLTRLEWLSLEQNAVSEVSALSGLTSLTHLELHYNSISDVSALGGLTNLTFLLLHANAIVDIDALSGLTSLTWLSLGQNPIGDISAVSQLTGLTGLSLDYTSVVDVSALSGLTNLEYLWLNDNPSLTDIQALLDNTGIGVGDHVDLAGTSVSCLDVAALQAKGVAVVSDCP